ARRAPSAAGRRFGPSMVRTALDIDTSQLVFFSCRVSGQLSARASRVRMLSVALRAHGDGLAGRHRQRTGHQAGNASDHDVASAGTRGCNTDDETRGGNDAVIGAEHSRTEPANSLGSVSLTMSHWMSAFPTTISSTTRVRG